MQRTWTKAIAIAVTLVFGPIIASAQSGAADQNCQPRMMVHSKQHHAEHHALMMRHQKMARGGMMARHHRHMRKMMRHGAMHGGNQQSAMMGMHGKANTGMRCIRVVL